MNCLCSVVVDGALFFDDYCRRPVKGDVEIEAQSSSCPWHAAGCELEKCRFQKCWHSYWCAKARHPLGFVVEPRASLDITVSKSLELAMRIALRGTQGAFKCSCSWSLREPLIFVRIFIAQVWILGIHSKLCKGHRFRFRLKCFSHDFISVYWTGRIHRICEHRFFEKHLYWVCFFQLGVWHINCLCF